MKKLKLTKNKNKHLSSYVVQTVLNCKCNRFPQHPVYLTQNPQRVFNIQQNSGLRERCNFIFVARILFTVLSPMVILRAFLIFLQKKRYYVSGKKTINRLVFLIKRIVMSKPRYCVQLLSVSIIRILSDTQHNYCPGTF